MRELADQLEMKLGNLQYYFKTREALILEVMSLEGAKDVEIIKHHLQVAESPGDALDAIVSELVSRWRSKSGVLYSILGTLSLHNKLFRKLYREIYVEFYATLESLLQDLNPGLSDDDIKTRVRLITALIDGSAMQIRSGKADDYLAAIRARVKELTV